MPGPDQKIKTVLIPESGLDLSPEFIEQSIVTPDFSRVFAHLIGKADDRGILIRATSDGSLRVVSAGVPFEYYDIFSGTSDDPYTAVNTKEYPVAYNVTDFLIETHPVKISFRNLSGIWLADKILLVGFHSIDFIHYGIKVKDRTAPNNGVYEITSYR
ncbi:MAG: hypothetical protein GH151_15190 [Bacteroidetes bacterium]|nr:hypothetical protein [Bacteroidota bacterium]